MDENTQVPAMPEVGTMEEPAEVQEYDKENPAETNVYQQENPQENQENQNTQEQNTQEQENQQAEESETPKTAESDKTQSETPSAEDKFEDIVKEWTADRESLLEIKKENAELKSKLSQLEERSDEYMEMDEQERIDAIIAKRDKEAQQAKQAEQEEVQKEISFYEKTDPYFAQNKAKVLDNCSKFNCTSISQGIMITKGQDAVKQKAQKPIHKPLPPKKASVKQTAGNPESFGEMYRQGGIN
jgi:chromosome segregation ATPase